MGGERRDKAMTERCDFCQIVKNDDPNARVLYRDLNVTAFLPLTPATKGHALVVPNRHVAEHVDLSDAESRQLGSAVRRTAKAVRAALSPDGINIIQSTGEAATQTVPHVHFHVVPRWTDDHMVLAWPEHEAEGSDAQDLTLLSLIEALPSSAADISPEDRRQHLSFVQAVITRMSQASSSAKTWLLPIVTLTFGYAVTQKNPWAALFGIVAILVFGVLDANYLKQERAFRKLYDSISSGGAIPNFSMNPALAGPTGGSVNYWPDWQDIRSWAVAPIYGPLLIVGVAIARWTIYS